MPFGGQTKPFLAVACTLLECKGISSRGSEYARGWICCEVGSCAAEGCPGKEGGGLVFLVTLVIMLTKYYSYVLSITVAVQCVLGTVRKSQVVMPTMAFPSEKENSGFKSDTSASSGKVARASGG